MKTLANCDNIEFMQQTYKIADAVKGYLTETKIMDLRKRIPDTSNMSEEEKKTTFRKAATDNIMDMIRVALIEHAEDTLRILGLICFCEDSETLRKDRNIMIESVSALSEPSVIDFFISLMRSVAKLSKTM